MSLLATVQEQLSTVDELLIELSRSAAEQEIPRPSLLANIRALEKQRRTLHAEFERAAVQAQLDVYKYSILNRDRATLTGLTEAWRGFQHVLSVVYQAMHGGVKASRKAKQKEQREPKRDAIELGFGYSFSGSVGVALTLPNQKNDEFFVDETIERATAEIFAMAKSYDDHEQMTAIARRLGPAPVEAMYQWVDAHVTHGFGVRIEWRRDDAIAKDVLVQFEEFQKLKDEISRTTFETQMTVTGELEAVDITARTFRLRSDNGEEIEGEYEDAITEEHKATLPSRYEADIVKVTKVVVVGADPKSETFVLKKLKEL